MGLAKLDREGFIDMLNSGASRIIEGIHQEKTCERILRNRGLKWVNEETLSHLCGEAIESYLEEFERKCKRSRRRRTKSPRKKRRNRSNIDSDYSSNSESEGSDISSSGRRN